MTTDDLGRFETRVPPGEALSYVRVGSATLSFGAINDTVLCAANPNSPLLKHVPFMVELKREAETNGSFDAGDIQLENGVALLVDVFRADGSPASGVQVWAEPVVDIRRDAYEFSPHAGRYALTNDAGQVTFGALRPREIMITVRDRPRDDEGQPKETRYSKILQTLRHSLPANQPQSRLRIDLPTHN